MNYKKKNIILAISFCVFLWLSWKLAIGETVELAEELNHLDENLKSLEDAPEKIRLMEAKLEQVEGKTKKLYSGVLEMRKELLAEVTKLSLEYNLSLKKFPDYYSQEKEGIELTTSPIVLSGDFKKMVRFIHEFEQKNVSGKISSTLFKINESPRNKVRTLYLTLYIQSINL